jgi:hypothetical protein
MMMPMAVRVRTVAIRTASYAATLRTLARGANQRVAAVACWNQKR